MLWSTHSLGTRTLFSLGHGCSGHCMLLEYTCYYGLGMEALVAECSENVCVSALWAWMLW